MVGMHTLGDGSHSIFQTDAAVDRTFFDNIIRFHSESLFAESISQIRLINNLWALYSSAL